MTSRVRECRRKTDVLLIEAANYLGMPPSFLSAMEVGRPYPHVPEFFQPKPDFQMPNRHRFNAPFAPDRLWIGSGCQGGDS